MAPETRMIGQANVVIHRSCRARPSASDIRGLAHGGGGKGSGFHDPCTPHCQEDGRTWIQRVRRQDRDARRLSWLSAFRRHDIDGCDTHIRGGVDQVYAERQVSTSHAETERNYDYFIHDAGEGAKTSAQFYGALLCGHIAFEDTSIEACGKWSLRRTVLVSQLGISNRMGFLPLALR